MLTNLAQPKHDYIGGEIWVYMGDSEPNLNDDFLEEKCVVLGDKFEIGDNFAFPYDKWHKVHENFNATYQNGRRISLLIPLACRNNEENKNKVLL